MKYYTCENFHSLKNSFELFAFVLFPMNLYNIGWRVYESFGSQTGMSLSYHDSLSHLKVIFGTGWL
jgi:hypothetical protein